MGISGDLLTASTPARLVFRRGSWCLELERLVAIDRNVYQPRLQRLEGGEAIVQHLKRTTENPVLVHAASALIRGARPERDCSFEAVDNEWAPCDSRARSESCSPSTSPGALAAAEQYAELCLLRATQQGLRERLARAEALLASHVKARELGLARSAAIPKISQLPAREPVPISVAAPAAPSLVPAAEDASSASASPPSVPVTPAARQKAQLPPASAIGACLHTLLGRKVGVNELKAVVFPPKNDDPCWISLLIDDDGIEVGVIVADLQATIGLGGALMMIPPAELDAQRAAKTPSEDVLSAMSEVVNNLSATINQQPEGCHVRVKELEPMAPGSLHWTRIASLASGLELAGNLGHLYLFAR